MTPTDEATFIALWTEGLTTAVEPDRPPHNADWEYRGEQLSWP
jgi:hypothetical protein